ncbi:hypothetical protein PR202_ga18725 [Eleusine coracana subsp. coracana]|uniref:IBH1-like N-terminal domain-containing protein n=1 Tax=Eleusine coracana subsp. coracana TaxID=191504 RepID=A0AAV5CTM5_ELECO|nr:hypothetical protein QOZ80_4AG0300800 [Eleusine coracana subsp. coracana]GJN01458.1 hypothetical protein PR202_ga18725 [Eleusine coracana subsp. coracana]
MAVKRTAPSPPTPRPNPNPNRRAPVSGADAASPSKRMLAFHFIRALARIHRSTPVPRRTRTIRRAAYSSMARAANPRRVWSRALLQQMRARRARTRRAAVLRRRVSAAPATPPGGARSITGEDQESTTLAALARTTAAAVPHRQAGEPARADALRRLVPGGNEMEYSNLLEETADYVRCLRAQVQLMQGLVDLFSGR